MNDEIESKLLEEIDEMHNSINSGEFSQYEKDGFYDKKLILNGKIIQHRQTKKWIKGLIEFIENNSDVDEEGFKLLKKQIHGLDGCNGSKSKKAISHSSGEGK